MKIGIISDIHGNIDALNSVLKMLEKEEVDKIICLGDFIGRSRKIWRSNTKNLTNKGKVYMCKRKSRKIYNRRNANNSTWWKK